jgi:hypothetical protein
VGVAGSNPVVRSLRSRRSGSWLIENWGGFSTRAHGWAAVIFFLFLGLPIVIHAHCGKQRKLLWIYAGTAALILVGSLNHPALRVGGEHTGFWLKAWDILMFATYLVWRTVENWGEEVQPEAAPQAPRD